ncbi:hypothetical protein [Sedimentitalea sp.]|uniref:hypothetical protein n=1 Tax=Sedimentitalea sp. TaxID=2048915 RepID=UPI0032971919
MKITQALHLLGYPENLKASQSKFVYQAEDGVWICTLWRDRLDYDAGLAHVNLRHAPNFKTGIQVRVVLITRQLLENGGHKIKTAEPDNEMWTVSAMVSPTAGFDIYRAFLVRAQSAADVAV